MEIASLFDWQTIISGTLVAIIGCLVRYYSKKIEKYKREAEAKEAERRESENRRRKFAGQGKNRPGDLRPDDVF